MSMFSPQETGLAVGLKALHRVAVNTSRDPEDGATPALAVGSRTDGARLQQDTRAAAILAGNSSPEVTHTHTHKCARSVF